MQKEKIDNLEIDLKELRYLLEKSDKEPMLARSAMRLIDLMKECLDEIRSEISQPVKIETVPVEEKTVYIEEEELSATVLGEQLRPALELSKGLTLNDTFRFSRELFNGDKDKMNEVLQEITTMASLADVVSYLSTHMEWDEENDATQDFMEFLKKYFV